MKIAILTYPIHSNFGFLMQAYALQTYLRKLGHEPFTFYITPSQKTCINKLKQTIKDIVYTVKGIEGYRCFRYWPTKEQQEYMDKKTWHFVKNNIQLTTPIKKLSDLYSFDVNDYDAYIVGSDQVWRYAYIDNITNFFFDFLPDEKPRMSYAASFGIGTLDYNAKDKELCKHLLKKFDVVTVREYDGVNICQKEFGVDAVKVLDPVFLLDKKHYSNLSALSEDKYNEKFLFTYILDPNTAKLSFVKKVASEKNLKVVNLLPEKFYLKGPTEIEKMVYPSVYDILKAINDSEYVITDSFHGTAFSILLNKQFTIFSNKLRGNSRLSSILKTFGLENRILSENHNYDDIIDFDNVNRIISEQRTFSYNILDNFLSDIE